MHLIKLDAPLNEVADALHVIRPGVGFELIRQAEGIVVAQWDGETTIPTDGEIELALGTLADVRGAADDKVKKLKRDVRGLVSSAVGKHYTALNAQERQAILNALLWKLGVLDRDGQVAPLDEWLR